MRLFGRLRRGYSATLLRLVGRRCRGYWHHHGGDAVICCGYSVCEVSQPERLNAEGFSLSALSRGWSVSATLGMKGNKEKASERRESSRRGSRYSRSSHYGGVARYRGFRFAPPPATSHSLRSGVRPFRSCCGVVFLSRIFSDSVMVALPRIYAGDCARRKSR